MLACRAANPLASTRWPSSSRRVATKVREVALMSFFATRQCRVDTNARNTFQLMPRRRCCVRWASFAPARMYSARQRATEVTVRSVMGKLSKLYMMPSILNLALVLHTGTPPFL